MKSFSGGEIIGLHFGVRLWEVSISGVSTVLKYSQLSRKQPPLVHEKVVAYKRRSLMGTINEISPKLYRSTNNNYYIKLLPLLVKIRKIGKAVAIKTNSFWFLRHV